jgi:hypothetical protein
LIPCNYGRVTPGNELGGFATYWMCWRTREDLVVRTTLQWLKFGGNGKANELGCVTRTNQRESAGWVWDNSQPCSSDRILARFRFGLPSFPEGPITYRQIHIMDVAHVRQVHPREVLAASWVGRPNLRILESYAAD